MNEKTRTKFILTMIYGYIKDLDLICSRMNYEYAKMLDDVVYTHAIKSCLAQIGEEVGKIGELDKDLYENSPIPFKQIRGLRNRIIHDYGSIDKETVNQILQSDIPNLKKYIEQNVIQDVLYDPYQLYEKEYDDVIKESQKQSLKPKMKIRL